MGGHCVPSNLGNSEIQRIHGNNVTNPDLEYSDNPNFYHPVTQNPDKSVNTDSRIILLLYNYIK